MLLHQNFYTLLGALRSAMDLVGFDMDFNDQGSLPARGDSHLDPLPEKLTSPLQKLGEVWLALRDAEVKLRTDLDNAAGVLGLRAAAWKSFEFTVTEASFVFAGAMRRILWAQTGPNPSDGLGAFGWDRLEPHMRFIMKTWAALGLGGGHDHAAADYPGIFGSSAESIPV